MPLSFVTDFTPALPAIFFFASYGATRRLHITPRHHLRCRYAELLTRYFLPRRRLIIFFDAALMFDDMLPAFRVFIFR